MQASPQGMKKNNKSFKDNKIPSPGGFPSETYKIFANVFFPSVSAKMFSQTLEDGLLRQTLNKALYIRYSKKKGKNKNWHPEEVGGFTLISIWIRKYWYSK